MADSAQMVGVVLDETGDIKSFVVEQEDHTTAHVGVASGGVGDRISLTRFTAASEGQVVWGVVNEANKGVSLNAEVGSGDVSVLEAGGYAVAITLSFANGQDGRVLDVEVGTNNDGFIQRQVLKDSGITKPPMVLSPTFYIEADDTLYILVNKRDGGANLNFGISMSVIRLF